MDRIYLDHNATAPMLPAVAAAMADYYRAQFANPASQHADGRRAKRLIEDARDEIAAMLGARSSGPQPDRLIFTSGGSEANNLALLGLASGAPGVVAVSTIEHSSLAAPAAELVRRGWQLEQISVTAEGVISVDYLHQLVDSAAGKLRLASIMLANSETGIRQPVQQCAEVLHRAGTLVHTDAVPVVGKLPVDFRELGVDAMSIAAHKFHGPKGIGALVLKASAVPYPQVLGGLQQGGFRAGTESVELILGMQKALSLWKSEAEARTERLTELRDRFESQILAGWPTAVVHGASVDRLPHTSNIALAGLDRQALVVALDMAGISCSTGSACASGSSEPSPVLLAMGCKTELVQSSLRFSLGAATTAAEVDHAVERILNVCRNLAKRSAPGKSGFSSRVEREKSL